MSTHVRVGVVTLGALGVMTAVLTTSACTPSSRDVRPRPQSDAASGDARRWEVRSVSMPDVSRLPQSVQAQVRDRYTALAEKTASPATPSEQLARAHGDVGLILM